MELDQIKINKSALLKMPAHERDFFVLAGHIINELIILAKLILVAQNYLGGEGDNDDPYARAAVSQQMLFVKIFASKLLEAWKSVRSRYYRPGEAEHEPLSKIYHKLLTPESHEALKKLGCYFGGDNKIKTLRNKSGFHYDMNNLQSTLEAMPDNSEFVIYLADSGFNCLHFLSEATIGYAMLDAKDMESFRIAFEKLFDEIIKVHGWMMTFLDDYIAIFGDRNNLQLSQEKVDIGEVPIFEDHRLPLFTTVPNP